MNEGVKGVSITPDTTVKALLESYPQLEDSLIEMVPAFSKLRNPVLRRTVAKVATLRQAARVGQLDLSVLINRLRQEIGLDDLMGTNAGEPDGTGKPPEWFDQSLVSRRFDARELIETGEHPMPKVMEDLNDLEEGRIYELTTAFIPSPLIEMMKDKGYRIWTHQEEGDLVRTYFLLK